MSLTDVQLRKLPKDYVGTLNDKDGLRLLCRASGRRTWQLRVYYEGTRKTLTFGDYPTISLKLARELATEAKIKKAKGIAPASTLQRKTTDEDMFLFWVKAWFQDKCSKDALAYLNQHGLTKKRLARYQWTLNPEKAGSNGWGVKTAAKRIGQVFNHMLPSTYDKTLTAIKPNDILLICERAINGDSGHDVAKDIIENFDQIYTKAMRREAATMNPAYKLKEELPPHTSGHYAAITDPDKFGELLLAIRSYGGRYVARMLLRIAPYLWQRPGELRFMRWDEVDLEHCIWVLDAERMKMSRDHIVPLPKQVVAILTEMRDVTGRNRYVFTVDPAVDEPACDATVARALERLGYKKEQTFHGFRASARTIFAEWLGIDPNLLEIQLAHKTGGSLGEAYDRTQYIEQRVKMMQDCADFYDTLLENARDGKKLGKGFLAYRQ